MRRFDVAILLVAVASTGCHRLFLKPHLVPGESLAANEIVVVGKIVLEPPLDPADQHLSQAMYPELFRNAMMLMFEAEQPDTIEMPSAFDLGWSFPAPLGETFYARLPADHRHLVVGTIVMSVDMGQVTEQALFPLALSIDLQPGDRAVYVGTLRCERDDYLVPTGCSVVDDFDMEAATFRERFGGEYELVRRLVSFPPPL